MNLGESIKEIRKAKGVTQEELALYLGLTQQTIAGYESGRRKPDINIIPKIAEYLEVSIENIFDIKDNKSKKSDERIHPNSRAAKLQEHFAKLSPTGQRFIIKQIEGIVKES